MVKVAVAGGSGVVGRTLVDVFAKQSKHEAVVLTRKVRISAKITWETDHQPKDPPDQSQRLTSASGRGRLYRHRRSHNHPRGQRHRSHNQHFRHNTNLTLYLPSKSIKAAEASETVKRFIPTSFAIKYPKDAIAILPPLQNYFDSLDQLKKTHLEWTTVNNGIFLDYFMPPDQRGHFDPSATLVLDILNNKAAIPGTGNERITFTYTRDVARFVVAALDLDTWPEDHEFNVVGDTMTFNEFLKVLEESKAVKFDVAYDGMEKLENFEVTELPGHQNQYGKFPKEKLLPFLSIFERWMAEGRCEIAREGSLNEMFPDIKTLGVEEMVEKYWNQA